MSLSFEQVFCENYSSIFINVLVCWDAMTCEIRIMYQNLFIKLIVDFSITSFSETFVWLHLLVSMLRSKVCKSVSNHFLLINCSEILYTSDDIDDMMRTLEDLGNGNYYESRI